MSSGAVAHPPARARAATAAIFFVVGATWGNWVTRVPDVQRDVHTRSGPLGAALLCIAVGALASRPWCSRLVQRYGSERIAPLAGVCCCLSLTFPALADDIWTLGLALTVFGAALGCIDLAMNAHAVVVERCYGRLIMSLFHGVYSIGGLVGALVGGQLAAMGLTPFGQFVLVAAVLSVATVGVTPFLQPPSMGRVKGPRRPDPVRLSRAPRRVRVALILLGVIGFCSMTAEGAAGDWGAVYLHDDLATNVAVASWGFASYSVGMIVGRLMGVRWLERWGDWRAVTITTTTAALGFSLALALANPVVAICGFALLGLGMSIVVPVVISRAGRTGETTTVAAPAVAFVSSVGQLGPVVGPPLIGFLAEPFGLPAALGTVSVLALLAAALIQVVRRLMKSPPSREMSFKNRDRPTEGSVACH